MPYARDLILAPRLPAPPKEHTGNPFTSDGDLVASCTMEGCGYNAMGPRKDLKLALAEHCRRFHPGEEVAFHLNDPTMI